MADTAVPEFFQHFPMQTVSAAGLDQVLAESPAQLDILFLWGRDCPNCDIAKRVMLQQRPRLAWPQVRWLHCNVYADDAMGPRLGLHGIPVFYVYRRSQRLGRITAWPGIDAFCTAIAAQLAAHTD